MNREARKGADFESAAMPDYAIAASTTSEEHLHFKLFAPSKPLRTTKQAHKQGMELSQELIDEAVKVYNIVTEAHKRPPVERYICKQLDSGEAVELTSGKKRWSSALQFAGTSDDVEINFLINPALPERFKKQLEPIKEQFTQGIARLE